MKKENILSRLTIIKYLYKMGVEQSLQPPPINYASLLTFHNVAELFLILGAEKLDAAVNKKMFILDFWNCINQQLEGRNISLKASFKRLNKARNAFKHYGITPSQENIREFGMIMENFLIENTPIIFNMEFEEISLFDLIQDKEVKEILLIVKRNLNKKKYKRCLELCAVSFAKLLKNYEKDKTYLGKSIFQVGTSKSSFRVWDSHKNRELSIIRNRFKQLQEDLKILIFNIDFRKYIKFKLLTPDIINPNVEDIKEYSFFKPFENKKIYTEENVDFCINFIINSALKLQEFDIEIDLE